MLEVRIRDDAPGPEESRSEPGRRLGDQRGGAEAARLNYRVELDVPEEGVARQDAAVLLDALDRALSGQQLLQAPPAEMGQSQRVIVPMRGEGPAGMVSGLIEVSSREMVAAEPRPPERRERGLEAALMAHLAAPRADAAQSRAPVNLEAALRGDRGELVWDDDVGFLRDPPAEEWTGRGRRSRMWRIAGGVVLGFFLTAAAGLAGLAWQGRIGFARDDQPARTAGTAPAAARLPAAGGPRPGAQVAHGDGDRARGSDVARSGPPGQPPRPRAR